jgi:hypothetical protein
MPRQILIAVLVVTAMGATAQAAHSVAKRPTAGQANFAVRATFTDFAEGLDGRLIIGPCVKRGAYMRVCNAHVKGPEPVRLRARVWRSGGALMVSARLRH